MLKPEQVVQKLTDVPGPATKLRPCAGCGKSVATTTEMGFTADSVSTYCPDCGCLSTGPGGAVTAVVMRCPGCHVTGAYVLMPGRVAPPRSRVKGCTCA